jgi:deoxyxylulose-5-phosphate synthase
MADGITSLHTNASVTVLGLPTQFIPHAKPAVILARLGLDADGIVKTAQQLLKNA